jgi:hypothetical protein
MSVHLKNFQYLKKFKSGPSPFFPVRITYHRRRPLARRCLPACARPVPAASLYIKGRPSPCCHLLARPVLAASLYLKGRSPPRCSQPKGRLLELQLPLSFGLVDGACTGLVVGLGGPLLVVLQGGGVLTHGGVPGGDPAMVVAVELRPRCSTWILQYPDMWDAVLVRKKPSVHATSALKSGSRWSDSLSIGSNL